jgi:Na+/melibiose symporter-like transporter
MDESRPYGVHQMAMFRWALAFIFTQLAECPIYYEAMGDKPASRAARMALAFGASAITHPVVWFVFPWIWSELGRPGGYWSMVVAAETFAVVVEAAYLWAFGLRRALPWALTANATSLSLGLLSRHLFGYP